MITLILQKHQYMAGHASALVKRGACSSVWKRMRTRKTSCTATLPVLQTSRSTRRYALQLTFSLIILVPKTSYADIFTDRAPATSGSRRDCDGGCRHKRVRLRYEAGLLDMTALHAADKFSPLSMRRSRSSGQGLFFKRIRHSQAA